MNILETAKTELNKTLSTTKVTKATAIYFSEKYPALYVLYTTVGGVSERVNKIELYENRNYALQKSEHYYTNGKMGGGVLFNKELIN